MNRCGRKQSQQGAALVVCLVILLGMTVVGIASMKETSTQQKVVNAVTEDDTAFQAAEYALRECEQFILNYTQGEGKKLGIESATLSGVTITVIDPVDLDDGWWKDDESDVWDLGTQVAVYPRVNNKDGNSKQRMPSCVVEFLARGESNRGSVSMTSDDDMRANYRITARGFGLNDSYYAVLQSTYRVQM